MSYSSSAKEVESKKAFKGPRIVEQTFKVCKEENKTDLLIPIEAIPELFPYLINYGFEGKNLKLLYSLGGHAGGQVKLFEVLSGGIRLSEIIKFVEFVYRSEGEVKIARAAWLAAGGSKKLVERVTEELKDGEVVSRVTEKLER